MILHPDTLNLFALIAPIWVIALIRSNIGKPIILLSLLSLFLLINNFYRISIDRLSTDLWGHLQYINYIEEHLIPPSPVAGWQYYHPPLYYWLAALFDSASQYMHANARGLAMRYLSLTCLLFFLFYGLRLINAVIRSPYLAFVVSAAALFWPLNLGFSGRVTNDVLLNPLWTAFFFYLLRWHRDLRKDDFCICLCLCALTFLVKNTAIVLLAQCGILACYNLFYKRIDLSYLLSKRMVIAVCILFFALSLNFGRTLYYKFTEEPKLGLIVGNIYMDPALPRISAPNNYKEMFTTRLSIFFATPFWGLWAGHGPISGKQYLVPSFIKTLILGEFYWPNRTMATQIDLLLMLIILFAGLTSLTVSPSRQEDEFLTINTVFIIGCYIANRIIHATYPTEDARFIYPVMFLILALCGRNAERLLAQGNSVVANYGRALLTYFAALLIVFTTLFAME